MLIIGITGTLGAGKGTIVEYLVKETRIHPLLCARLYQRRNRQAGYGS